MEIRADRNGASIEFWKPIFDKVILYAKIRFLIYLRHLAWKQKRFLLSLALDKQIMLLEPEGTVDEKWQKRRKEFEEKPVEVNAISNFQQRFYIVLCL